LQGDEGALRQGRGGEVGAEMAASAFLAGQGGAGDQLGGD
jgi:hypothetical protein